MMLQHGCIVAYWPGIIDEQLDAQGARPITLEVNG
jgi:hypothetical protein